MRENLINIISRCNNAAIKKQWILEMSNNGIECPESACDSCAIQNDCLPLLCEDYIIGGNC